MKLDGVSKIYGQGEAKTWALRDLCLTIHEGEFLGVIGQSGSGKTTLLNMIGGMDRPSEGEILFLDQNLAKVSDRELTHFRRHHIGFIFQFYNLIPTLTAKENIEVASSIAKDPLEIDSLMDRVGLRDRKDYFPAQMSGGQQQRVAIARALVSNPQILLCDEPTGNLDSATSLQVLELLAEVNQKMGKTVVMITHDGQAAEYAQRVVTIKDGEIVGD